MGMACDFQVLNFSFLVELGALDDWVCLMRVITVSFVTAG